VPVQATTRQARGCGDPTCRITSGQAGRHELVDIRPTGGQTLGLTDLIRPIGLRPRPDDDRELAPRWDPAVGPDGGGQFAERAALDRLMQLGELATDGARPVAPARRGQVAQRGGDATGRLEQDRPPLVRGDPLQTLAALMPGPRQEGLDR
jgi:hypothetical protein